MATGLPAPPLSLGRSAYSVRKVDRDELIAEVKRLAEAATDHSALAFLDPASGSYELIRAMNVAPFDGLEELGGELLKAFGFEAIAYFRGPEASVTAITPTSLALWAVAQSRFRPTEEVFAEFEHLVAANRATYLEIVPLWGISPTEEVDLEAEGIRLLPIERLPLSQAKDGATGARVLKIPGFGIELGIRPRATAALVGSVEVAPVFVQSTSVRELPGLGRELMYEVARMLVVAVEVPVVPFGYWTQAAPGTPYIRGGAGGFRISEGFLGRAPVEHVVNPNVIRELVLAYLNMDLDNRGRLEVPLSRLNSALVQIYADSVESMIDLGIALESFLCPDKQPTEVRYRFALRGALYLGGNRAAVAETRQTLGKLYDARSDAVHGGTRGKRSTDQQISLVKRGSSLLIAMLRKTMETGRVPGWEAIEIGEAGQSSQGSPGRG
jgi:hypothetical protein